MRCSLAVCAICAFLVLMGPAGAQTNNNQAIQDATTTIETNPDSAEAWWARGNVLWQQGNYDRALEDYNQAIEIDPTFGLAYLGRGNTYLRQGDYDRALEDYNLIIQYQPNFAGTYNNRAVAYREMGRNDMALEDLNRAIGLNGDFAEAYYNRALTYRSMGQQAMAQHDLKRAIELNPDLGKALGAAKGGSRSPLEVPKRGDKAKQNRTGGKHGTTSGDSSSDADPLLQEVERAIKADPVLGKIGDMRVVPARKTGVARKSARALPGSLKQPKAEADGGEWKLALACLLPVSLAAVLLGAFLYYRLKH